MDFMFQRTYRGSLRMAIFDWAGTTIDYGCMAPAGAFVELFKRHGVEATIEQARGPMGLHKRDHIATMFAMPPLAKQWEEKHGKPYTQDDVEALFQEFIPLQLDALPPFAKLIPGVAEVGKELKAMGMKLGGTTGYNEEMMNICREGAKAGGYEADISFAGSMVPAARPAPWMAVRCALEMNVYPFEACVKVGDTTTDIDEGLNAGMWTIGVTKTGNEVGLSEDEVNAMPAEELEPRIEVAAQKLYRAGAHYVVDGVADILPVVEEINLRLSQGERP